MDSDDLQRVQKFHKRRLSHSASFQFAWRYVCCPWRYSDSTCLRMPFRSKRIPQSFVYGPSQLSGALAFQLLAGSSWKSQRTWDLSDLSLNERLMCALP